MKKFILKTSFFVIPFFIFYILSIQQGTKIKGGLTRIGFLKDVASNNRDIFSNEFSLSRKFKYVSELNFTEKNKFSVLTIGDSFSQQNAYGFQNYLAHDSISVVHYNKTCNSIEILYNLLNGDFFEKIEVDFVVIQSVEREIINRVQNVDFNNVINYNKMIDNEHETMLRYRSEKIKNKKNSFFAETTIMFPLRNFLYLFDDNAINSKIYKVEIDSLCFFAHKKELLFYEDDLINVKLAYDIEKINNLNNHLNKLESILTQKGIKLIVLISPDKYNIYHKHILKKENYPKPVFFDNFKKLSKNYEFIESEDLLRKAIIKQKEIYFYDGTHWSPLGSALIAEELKKVMENNGFEQTINNSVYY